MAKRPIVATYYFPNWHSDPRIEALHGKGWSEWRVTQHATPRFPGHLQPKVPLWGYQDESKPEVMEQNRCVHFRLVLLQRRTLPRALSERRLPQSRELRKNQIRVHVVQSQPDLRASGKLLEAGGNELERGKHHPRNLPERDVALY